MDTLTRRRLMAIGLSLAGLPGSGRAQTKEAPKDLPKCPTPSGALGDWEWSAYPSGAVLRATVVRIEEQGDLFAEPSPRFLVLTAGGEWYVSLRLSRRPASMDVSVAVLGGGKRATASVPSTIFRPEFGYWFAYIDLTAAVKAVDPAQSTETTLEFIGGKSTLGKLVVGTRGFTEALAKANLEVKPLRAMMASQACKECYLTTLCVEQIGLPDDCCELQTLRAYRDGPLRSLPGGENIILEYYREAPHIVAEMRRRGEEQRILPFYVTHVLPCVAFARLGLNRLALSIYRDMMRQLQNRYGMRGAAGLPRLPGFSALTHVRDQPTEVAARNSAVLELYVRQLQAQGCRLSSLSKSAGSEIT